MVRLKTSQGEKGEVNSPGFRQHRKETETEVMVVEVGVAVGALMVLNPTIPLKIKTNEVQQVIILNSLYSPSQV